MSLHILQFLLEKKTKENHRTSIRLTQRRQLYDGDAQSSHQMEFITDGARVEKFCRDSRHFSAEVLGFSEGTIESLIWWWAVSARTNVAPRPRIDAAWAPGEGVGG